jgi:alpha-galactosidase
MMTAEMLEAQADWLPHMEGCPLKATPQIEIPLGINAVDVPLDPALAIANRFADLAERELHGE